MSIHPPSDLILDVARAADPATRDAAARRLSALATRTDHAGPTFADVENAFRSAASTGVSARKRAAPATDASSQATAGLETFFLRKAFDAMLPAAKKGGAAAGADMWRSMLADTLANQVAAAGGLGILRTAGGPV